MTPVVTRIDVELPAHNRGQVYVRVFTARGSLGTLFAHFEEAAPLVAILNPTLMAAVDIQGPDGVARDFSRRYTDASSGAVRDALALAERVRGG